MRQALALIEEYIEEMPITVRGVFTHVTRDGVPQTSPLLEGTRVLSVRRGTIMEVRAMIDARQMSLGYPQETLLNALEETQTQIDIIETTLMPDSYLNDPQTPFPHRAIDMKLAPRMR